MYCVLAREMDRGGRINAVNAVLVYHCRMLKDMQYCTGDEPPSPFQTARISHNKIIARNMGSVYSNSHQNLHIYPISDIQKTGTVVLTVDVRERLTIKGSIKSGSGEYSHSISGGEIALEGKTMRASAGFCFHRRGLRNCRS